MIKFFVNGGDLYGLKVFGVYYGNFFKIEMIR